MTLIDAVRFIPRRLISDERGWFLTVIDGRAAAGLTHVFVNRAAAQRWFLLLAYAANRYDPADTIPLGVSA
jgi:hypothetical protein